MFSSILVAVDLSEKDASVRAVQAGAQMAHDYGATLHVMTVVPDMGMSIVGSYFPADYEEKAVAEGRNQLKAFLEEIVPGDVEAKGHVAHGGIYQEILRIADELPADLIVMASHRPAMRDYLLGPNAAHVVRHARQSVLVVRKP